MGYAEQFRYLETEGRDLSAVSKTVELPELVTAPVRRGETAGRAVYTLDGEEIGSVAILYREDVDAARLRGLSELHPAGVSGGAAWKKHDIRSTEGIAPGQENGV